MNLPDLSGAADVAAARRIVTRLLEAADKDSPALDARLLIQFALDLDHAALASAGERTLTDTDKERIAHVVARRLRGEPVSRIVGKKEFYGRSFALSPPVLVPRPETETLVDAALEAVRVSSDAWHSAHRIADLGTGSGALLLVLLMEIPTATGVGTDRSHDAIATARANAAVFGLSNHAGFAVMDFGAALNCHFDLVVSNPPYIRSSDIASLPREVREHDPHLALDGGVDGLSAYRVIAQQAAELLREGGALVLEIGMGQAPLVEAIMTAGGAFALVSRRNDLAGIVRALTFRRQTFRSRAQ